MKAVIGYYYPTGEWTVIDLMAGPLSVGAETYKRCQTKDLCYTEIVEVPVKVATATSSELSVIVDDDFEFPDVLTLEQSIANNKKFLGSLVNR